MSLFGQSKRPANANAKGGRRIALPLSHPPEEKYNGSAFSHSRTNSLTSPLPTGPTGWFTVIYIPLPSLPSVRGRRHVASPGAGMMTDARGYYVHPPPSSAYPTTNRRHLKIYLPIPRFVSSRIPLLSRPTPLRLLVLLALVVTGLVVGFGLNTRRRHRGGSWTDAFGRDRNGVVLTDAEIGRIWEWEIHSGHHPSSADVPDRVPFPKTFLNPAYPRNSRSINDAIGDDGNDSATSEPLSKKVVGAGPERNYLKLGPPLPPWEDKGGEGDSEHDRRRRETANNLGFAPRPRPGSVLDLDRVLEKCDFEQNKYVRDCLEYLRIGGNLDNGRRFRRTNWTTYEHVFIESQPGEREDRQLDPIELARLLEPTVETNLQGEVRDRTLQGLSRDPLSLHNPLQPSKALYNAQSPCDAEHPRIFHMFWAGPFTDKPYMAVLSFLFTQNVGLDRLTDDGDQAGADTCRPQFWVWINPGPAAAVPNPSARREMYESLAINPWSAPFLHARFQDVVKFKMWNTTEQLDGIDELKDYWREMPIFNSGGNTYGVPQAVATPPPPIPFEARNIDTDPVEGGVAENEGMVVLEQDSEPATTPPVDPAPINKQKAGGIFEQVGSTSENDYDRLSVILSDMARFILTHRYGGIYIDADTIFLRDWEELWNWHGQFAYRWSWHQKYNTAVLKLHKGSALGKFLFKTALENGLDFHPMTISDYLNRAGLDKLLFRIPDALFDPAWLNMEGYQRDRPPFPYFPEFIELFSNDKFGAAGPHPLGFDAFYRGAFSYHFHNFWWRPFDPSRNWPDLGPRFLKGEKTLRQAARAAKILAENPEFKDVDIRADVDEKDSDQLELEEEKDEDDLSWSTVLKRTFEAYIRSERPNMYGEWLIW